MIFWNNFYLCYLFIVEPNLIILICFFLADEEVKIKITIFLEECRRCWLEEREEKSWSLFGVIDGHLSRRIRRNCPAAGRPLRHAPRNKLGPRTGGGLMPAARLCHAQILLEAVTEIIHKWLKLVCVASLHITLSLTHSLIYSLFHSLTSRSGMLGRHWNPIIS